MVCLMALTPSPQPIATSRSNHETHHFSHHILFASNDLDMSFTTGILLHQERKSNRRTRPQSNHPSIHQNPFEMDAIQVN
jgi:hypothetical protein